MKYILVLFLIVFGVTSVYAEETVVEETVVEDDVVEAVEDEVQEVVSVAAHSFKQENWLYQKAGFREAVKAQRETKQPFLGYFYNGECTDDCDIVEEDLLKSDEFIKQTEGFSLVAINVDEDKRLGARYGVEEYPSLMIFKSKSSAQKMRLFEVEQPFKPEKILLNLQMLGIAPSDEPAVQPVGEV